MICFSFLFCVAIFSCFSQTVHAQYPSLDSLTIEQAQVVFPLASTMEIQEPTIAARAVYNGKELLGYISLSHEITRIPGYSGKPIAVLIGIDLDANITTSYIIYHEEPILVAGIQENQLQEYVRQYSGKSVNDKVRINAHGREGYVGIDGISGATITTMVLNQSIMATAKKVADALGLPWDSQTDALAVAATANLAPEIPLWEYNWREKIVHLVIMGMALFILLLILFFQDWLVRRTRIFNVIRISFLLFTVFYIGFWHMAQLSIINILAFTRMITDQFTWNTLLIDPLIFQLWGFVALASLLWGGGVFCGWLCPFGAMQELIFKISERFELPKYDFPTLVHERLMSIKYFILIALIGLSLESLTIATRLAEVEPFKTTFILQFQRAPMYVLYAIGLLVLSAFISKFYCKYLCPLGAALSFITRFRVFDWLRRRKECGRPCQACAAHCQMNAIKPTGEIMSTECIYCLECQVFYWDDHLCPPLVEKKNKRKKWERKRAESSIIPIVEQINKSPIPDENLIIQQTTNNGENP